MILANIWLTFYLLVLLMAKFIQLWWWGEVYTNLANKSTNILLVNNFYRVTLCVIAIFAVTRCPSACLPHWGMLFRRLKISSNFFHCQIAHHSSFLTPSTDTQCQGEPLQYRCKIQGGWEILRDFWLKSPSISETVRDRPMVAMEY